MYGVLRSSAEMVITLLPRKAVSENSKRVDKGSFHGTLLYLAMGKPLRPGNDPELRPRVLVQHREVLEQVSVWIAEEEGSGRHPADHARLIRLHAEKRERRNALCFQPLRRVQ